MFLYRGRTNVKALTEDYNRFIDLRVRDVKACSSTEVELMLRHCQRILIVLLTFVLEM